MMTVVDVPCISAQVLWDCFLDDKTVTQPVKKQWFCFRISGERRRKNHKFRANVVFNNLLSSQSISKNLVNSRLTTISAILLLVKADKKRKNWAGHRRVRNMQLQQKNRKVEKCRVTGHLQLGDDYSCSFISDAKQYTHPGQSIDHWDLVRTL